MIIIIVEHPFLIVKLPFKKTPASLPCQFLEIVSVRQSKLVNPTRLGLGPNSQEDLLSFVDGVLVVAVSQLHVIHIGSILAFHACLVHRDIKIHSETNIFRYDVVQRTRQQPWSRG
jgi:hypothetical protein